MRKWHKCSCAGALLLSNAHSAGVKDASNQTPSRGDPGTPRDTCTSAVLVHKHHQHSNKAKAVVDFVVSALVLVCNRLSLGSGVSQKSTWHVAFARTVLHITRLHLYDDCKVQLSTIPLRRRGNGREGCCLHGAPCGKSCFYPCNPM